MQNPFGHLYSHYSSLFRYPDGVVPNTLALAYGVIGYLVSILMMVSGGWLWLPGVLLLSHSLVISAYLLHECTHGSLFRVPAKGEVDYHQRLAMLLSWLTGACHGELEKIREKHLRHHFERADISSLDYRQLLAGKPKLKRLIEVGQRCCLPAVDLLMHCLVMIRPWIDPSFADRRQRVVTLLIFRAAFFILLGVIGGWQALLGYAVAYLLFLTVLNFMDAFQHQYLLLTGLDEERTKSPTKDSTQFAKGYFNRDYENQHTWSNLLSQRWPALNLLVLNFPYHSVHHQRPMEPWYRLPRLHRETVTSVDTDADNGVQTIPLSEQLKLYFRYRVERVMAPASDRLGGANLGAAGVSFLTPL